jgi:hypothetical protein
MLTSLSLTNASLWYNPAAAAALLDAVTAHPRLHTLNLEKNNYEYNEDEEWQAATGTALSKLLLADAPTLQTLRINYCGLGDAGLGPLFLALPRNTHLRTLHCHDNSISEAFTRDVLLPAVRANTSLRELQADGRDAPAAEAMELVTRRRDAASAN